MLLLFTEPEGPPGQADPGEPETDGWSGALELGTSSQFQPVQPSGVERRGQTVTPWTPRSTGSRVSRAGAGPPLSSPLTAAIYDNSLIR